MSETRVTVEPERFELLVQEGRVSARESTESSQLHVIDPGSDGPAAVLVGEADGLRSEIELHDADVTALLSGLEGVTTDA